MKVCGERHEESELGVNEALMEERAAGVSSHFVGLGAMSHHLSQMAIGSVQAMSRTPHSGTLEEGRHVIRKMLAMEPQIAMSRPWAWEGSAAVFSDRRL